MIDWKRKLSSRKLWMAVAGFVSGLMIFFGRSESEATQVSALIMQGACVIAYIISEGFIDSASVGVTFDDGGESDDVD
jgi:hypothetical protein